MANYIRSNVEDALAQAKQKISFVLNDLGYTLVNDLHNTQGVETRIYQWTNVQHGHCFQLIWDGKEDWFELGEFECTDNLNYLNARQILLVPVKKEKLWNRKHYIRRKVDQLIQAIIRRNEEHRQ
jgi:hypothetical protein